MTKTLPSEFYTRISTCIEELKASSSIVDVCQIIDLLQEHYDLEGLNAEDILPRILSAAKAQGVALKLAGGNFNASSGALFSAISGRSVQA